MEKYGEIMGTSMEKYGEIMEHMGKSMEKYGETCRKLCGGIWEWFWILAMYSTLQYCIR